MFAVSQKCTGMWVKTSPTFFLTDFCSSVSMLIKYGSNIICVLTLQLDKEISESGKLLINMFMVHPMFLKTNSSEIYFLYISWVYWYTYTDSDAIKFLKSWDRILEQKPIFSRWKRKTIGSSEMLSWKNKNFHWKLRKQMWFIEKITKDLNFLRKRWNDIERTSKVESNHSWIWVSASTKLRDFA